MRRLVFLQTALAAAFTEVYMNPWIQALIDGEAKKLMVSSNTQGIVLFKDMEASEQIHRNSQVSIVRNGHSTATMVKIVRRPRHNTAWPTDGVIGLGIKSARHEQLWPFVNASEINSIQYTYRGMDLKTGEANIQFGPPSGTVTWTEPMNAFEDFYYQRYTSFPMYQLTMCGRSLTEPTSSYWNAVIDFKSPCLTLPKEFYTALVAWAPLSFNATANLTNIESGFAPSDLPTLHFQTSHFSQQVSLPLRDLVTPTNNSQLCIRRGESVRRIVIGRSDDFPEEDNIFGDSTTEMRIPNMYRSPILLGTYALQSLGLIVHSNDTKLGFQATDSTSKSISLPEASCRPATKCIGHQKFHKDKNTCTDPDCNRWLYHTFDATAKTCVANPFWQIVAAVIIAVCTFYEFYYDYLRRKWSEQLIKP